LPVKGAPARILMVLMFFAGCFIFGLVAALLYTWGSKKLALEEVAEHV